MPRKLKMNAMDWVISKMHESFKKYHTRVIFIDHLHYLFDIARTKSPSIEIGTIIRRLKLVAVEYGYIIFLLCHTKKGASDNEKLTYELIRDSSFVSQESDTVLMIARDVKNPMSNNAWVSVEFHRRTGILHKVIDLVKVNGYLREFSKHESKSEGDLIQ
ncbi:MAG: DnaB-like helicase C-terminal domain-containing protein [Promethearchaeota archaeon]